MNFQEISYPVFQLKKSKPILEGTVLYYQNCLINKETEEEITNTYVIDDTSVPGNTLGRRRLSLAAKEVKLLKLSRAIFFLSDLVKLAKKGVWFIDNTGKIFEYVKNVRAKLIYKKIIKLVRIPSGGVIVEVEGIPTRFKALFPPTAETKYAGVLKIGMMYILYGFYKEAYKETWRMV